MMRSLSRVGIKRERSEQLPAVAAVVLGMAAGAERREGGKWCKKAVEESTKERGEEERKRQCLARSYVLLLFLLSSLPKGGLTDWLAD